MFPFGPLVNAFAVMVGSLIGIYLGSRLPDKMRTTVFQCLGLVCLLIGLQMGLGTKQPVLVIFSLLLGGIIGEYFDIERKFLDFGNKIRTKIKSKNPLFTAGFVNASVLFCIGAMSIIGSFDEGLRGDRTIVYSKSVLDGFTSIALASVYGIGVFLSAAVVFLYQGILVLCAGALQPYISDVLMRELTAVGGVIIMGIGLNLMEITQIRLSNLIPALVIAVILAALFL